MDISSMMILDRVVYSIYNSLNLGKAIEFIAPYIYYITGFFMVIYIIYLMKMDRIARFEQYLAQALYNMADYLDQGYSIEAALTYVSQDKSNPCSKYFAAIVQNLNAGQSYNDAINNVVQSVPSDSFKYIGEVLIATLNAQADVAKSLKRFAKQLQDILHFNRIIETKSAGAILTIKFLGALIMPSLFYLIVGIFVGIGEYDLAILPAQYAFLFINMLLLNFEDYFMFKDKKGSLVSLPLTLSLFLLVIIKIGPMIMSSLVA